MGSRSPGQTTVRRVLVFAIVALVLGVAAVTLLEVDESIARQGNELPQEILTVTKWFAIALGVAALVLWALERFRSHVGITVGVVIALVVVIATPIAIAIAKPDDTPMTVVAFDAGSGEQRWQHDVDLLFTALPLRPEGKDRITVFGAEPSGRCNTKPARFTIDRTDGHTISHAVEPEPATHDFFPQAPTHAGDIRLEVLPPQSSVPDGGVRPTQPRATDRPPNLNSELVARDSSDKVVWSIVTDGNRDPATLYADAAIVAAYVPATPDQQARIDAADPRAGPETVVAVFDARTGRKMWTMLPSVFEPPVFGPDVMFSLEGSHVMIRAAATGKVVARHALTAHDERSPDAKLRPTVQHDGVALAEGHARTLTVFDNAGRARWKATLPREMSYPMLTPIGDTIYVAGGGKLGYVCGGE